MGQDDVDTIPHPGLRTAVDLKASFNGFPYINHAGACLDTLWYQVFQAGPAIDGRSRTYCDKALYFSIHFSTPTLTLILETAVQPVAT